MIDQVMKEIDAEIRRMTGIIECNKMKMWTVVAHSSKNKRTEVVANLNYKPSDLERDYLFKLWLKHDPAAVNIRRWRPDVVENVCVIQTAEFTKVAEHAVKNNLIT